MNVMKRKFNLIETRTINQYRWCTFINSYDVELITIELCNARIHSVYKPPNKQFILPPLQQGNKPHVVIGDFNSHNTVWGYLTTGTDGEAVDQWAESSNLSLLHDAKLLKTFTSARWKKGYNHDLMFASKNIRNMYEKSILDPIPHTQHRPICVTVKPVIVPQPTPFKRRFNVRKADWLGYSTQVDQNIDEIDATPECYEN